MTRGRNLRKKQRIVKSKHRFKRGAYQGREKNGEGCIIKVLTQLRTSVDD
jgi:hypothetical protein